MVDVLPRFGLHNAAARGADRGHVEVTVAHCLLDRSSTSALKRGSQIGLSLSTGDTRR